MPLSMWARSIPEANQGDHEGLESAVLTQTVDAQAGQQQLCFLMHVEACLHPELDKIVRIPVDYDKLCRKSTLCAVEHVPCGGHRTLVFKPWFLCESNSAICSFPIRAGAVFLRVIPLVLWRSC